MKDSIIMLMGRPGCGKSSIGREVASKSRYMYISSGDVARTISTYDDKTKQSLQRGGMADEAEMRKNIFMLTSIILSNSHTVILDGFPRFHDQLYWLQQMFPTVNLSQVYVNVSADTCKDRLTKRGRVDDIGEVIDNRMSWYNIHTAPLIEDMQVCYNNINTIVVNNDSMVQLVNGKPYMFLSQQEMISYNTDKILGEMRVINNG